MTIKKLIKKCVEHILDEGTPTRAISDVSVQNQQPKYGQAYQQQPQQVIRNGQQVTITRSQVSTKREPNPVAEFLIKAIVILIGTFAVGALCFDAYYLNKRGDNAAVGLMMAAVGVMYGYHFIMAKLGDYTQLVKTSRFVGWGLNIAGTFYSLFIFADLLSDFRGHPEDQVALIMAFINIIFIGFLFFLMHKIKQPTKQID